MSEDIKIIKKNLTNKYKAIVDKLKIKESVWYVKRLKDDYLIVTELKILKIDKDLNTIWQHDYQKNLIMKAKIKDDLISVTEFSKSKYDLDLDTGKLIK